MKAHFGTMRRVRRSVEPVKHGLTLDEKQYPDMVTARCSCGERIVATDRAKLSERFHKHIQHVIAKNKYP